MALDVLDEVGAEERANAKDNKKVKQEKVNLEARANVLAKFNDDIFDKMQKNQVLKDAAQTFMFKSKMQTQLDYVKLQFKQIENEDPGTDGKQAKLAGISGDDIKDKFNTFRFTDEVLYMLQVIQNLLKKHD